MIKDKVFIFDISTSMCRVYKEARKTIEDAILQLQKSDTNRITVVEIGDFWEVVCKQKLPEEFDYKFLPSVATQHSSYFIDYLGPTILSLIEDLEDSDDVEIIIVGDDGANLGHEINFEDIKKICSDLDYKLTTPLSDFDNGYITMQGTTVNIPSINSIGTTAGPVNISNPIYYNTDSNEWTSVTKPIMTDKLSK